MTLTSSCAPRPLLAEQFQTLLRVSEAIASHRDLPSLFAALARHLRRVVQFEAVVLLIADEKRRVIRQRLLETSLDVGDVPFRELPMDEAPGGWVWQHQKPLIVPELLTETRWPTVMNLIRSKGGRSLCCLPLSTARNRVGAIGFASFRPNAYTEEGLEFLQLVASQVAVAVDNALAFEKIAELNAKLAEEKLYLEEEIRTQFNFEEIVGDSPAWQRVLRQAEIVAPTDSTVLVLGETGTGKELIARVIHNLSGRRTRTFVKVNCAAIPTGLLESELFGHERGAFTGALNRKIGRFELAHEGTLFLDEVGDIPLELQPKLLRVLQEQEFERLGGTKTLKTDVRIVAATNRNLRQMVAEGCFRSDLYYRLDVFPIHLPPLRERREDIPALVRYFAQKSARRMGRAVESIPASAMQALCSYDWPGNARELENFIERAVILSPGNTLRLPMSELARAPIRSDGNGSAATLADAEREHILRALSAANWVIGGPHGAAARLGLKRTTLQSRMQKLGIRREYP